jgi:energy-coupling factor transport system ATP-binding protein
VFQNPRNQFFNLDTTGEIAFGCENLGLPSAEIRERIQTTAHELGIEHLLDRNIFALSGGEKQKIAVASAYTLNPDIFVFDEPSSNLDNTACYELAALMKTLKAHGKTIVIAEHRLYYLAQLIDRAVYLNAGKILREWTQEEFLALPDTDREALGLRAVCVDALCPENHEARPASAPILTVSGLTMGYKRGKPVLNDINFAASPGEIIGIVGKNGQGKSTLARTLCGLHKEWRGAVALNGKSLKTKTRAGPFYLVMQESGYQLFTDSVENELRLSKSKKDRPSNEKVNTILGSLSLAALRDRHPMSLSGGEKQRTAIGTAMAREAAALIFDEPTSGLDFGNMRRVVGVVEQLRAEGKTIFIITHDYELLLAACTRILLLQDGCLASDFPLSEDTINKVKEIFS